MEQVVTAVMGGGQGTRLWPLTKYRAKPAVPVAGKFRLIDVALSNSLHAGVDRMFVLTQFNTASLHRHIAQTYRFDVFSSGFVNILAAEQNLDNRDWYQGTADAVRQNLPRLTAEASEILILSGDQLYLMDLSRLIALHHEREADITIAVKPVPPRDARGLGILRMNGDGRLIEFVEKPQDPEVIEALTLDVGTIEAAALDVEPGQLLASMGIYLFRAEVLEALLEGTEATDFGREVIPQAVERYRVFGFLHQGYWRDIGTIGSFHLANLELTLPLPPLNLYDPTLPIFTHPRFLPGSKLARCSIERSILSDGSILADCQIRRSIIGIRAVIRADSEIEESIVMGATEFERETGGAGERLGIGSGCRLRRAIVDLDARIGDGSQLVNEAGVEEREGDGYSIREGIIVVHRGARIPPGTVI